MGGDNLRTPLWGRIEQPNEGTLKRICEAEWSLENALHNRVPGSYPKDIHAARSLHRQLLSLNQAYKTAIAGLVVLTLVEVPPWCHGLGKDLWTFKPGAEWCELRAEDAAAGKTLYLSNLWYLPPGYAFIVELLIEAVILQKWSKELHLEQMHFHPVGVEWHSITSIHLGRLFAVGSVLDTLIFTWYRQPFRLTWFFRSGLLFLLPPVQHIFWNIFNRTVLAEFLSVAIFLLGSMVFFAWVAVTLFQKADVLAYREGEETVLANKELDTFSSALYTMFVAGVSGEFIDCFLPSFTVYHASGLLWMIYLVLTQVLLKNLVMDTLITAYLNGSKAELEKSTQTLADGVLQTFHKLANNQHEICEDDFLRFVQEYSRSPLAETMPPAMVKRMYEHYAPITKEKFCDVCEVLRNKYIITPRNSFLDLENSSNHYVEQLCKFVWEPTELPAFDQFMNKVLMINLILVIWESYYNLCDNENEPAWMDYVDIVFSFVYVGEVAVKLAVKSFAEYWHSAANQFDFWTTWLLLVTSLLPYLSASEGIDLSRYANILRLLRLVRILKQLKQYPSVQFMIFVVSRIFAAAGEILSLMGVSFFFFACLSTNLFGGLIYEGNPKLEGTEYAAKYWYVLNFNDMPSSLATWFMQILLEYVPLYAEAISKVSPYGSVSWIIVAVFYLTTAAIMYELLLAFTVDVYTKVKQEAMEDVSDDESEDEGGDHDHKLRAKQGGLCSAAAGFAGMMGEDPDLGIEPFSGRGSARAHDRRTSAAEPPEGEEAEEKAALEPGAEEHHEHAGHGHEEHEEGEEEEFEQQKVFEQIAKVFEERGQSLHWDLRIEPAAVRELSEAYEKCVHRDHHKGKQEGVTGDFIKAAWELENVIRLKEVLEYPVDTKKARRQHFAVLKADKWYYRAIVGLVILTIVEVPPWCHAARGGDTEHLWTWMPGTEWCPAPGGTSWKTNLSGIWYLPPGFAFIVEMVIEIIILWKFTLEYLHEKRHFKPIGAQYHNSANIYFGFIFACGSILDTAVFAVHRAPIRMTFLFRTGLLCLLPGVQRLFLRIASRKMMGEFTSVAVFFVGAVIFFAWVVVTIFKDVDEVSFAKEGGEEFVKVNEGLDTLRHSIYTMFLAGMTEGFLDILLPTYTKYRSSMLFWLVYLLVTQVLLLNLVIDAFVNAYLQGSEKLAEGSAKTTAKGMLRTFKMIGEDDEISKETFQSFVEEVGKSPGMPTCPPEAAEAIFEQFEGINKENFCAACSLLQNRIWLTPRDSLCKSGWLHKKVWEPEDNPQFDQFMSWVLLFNLIVVVAQSYYNLTDGIDCPTWLGFVSDLFTFIYIFEVAAKLLVKSWAEYWSSAANQFDFFTTWLLFCTGMLKCLPFASVKHNLAHYANLLRLLRLIRVVKQLKSYRNVQFMVSTVSKMMQASGDILSLLGVVLYFFTTFSVNFFGGVLTEGDPRLKETEYEKKHWFIFNFNDHIMAFVAWFTQLLGEYEPEWADALWRCSEWGDVAWWIFPAFYLIGVAILFEILKAFTIELYLALKEEQDREKDGGEAEEEEKEEMKEAATEEWDEEQEENKFLEEARGDLQAFDLTLHVLSQDSRTFKRKLKAVYKKACQRDEEQQNDSR